MNYALNTLYCRDCGSAHVKRQTNAAELPNFFLHEEMGYCEDCGNIVGLVSIFTLWDDFSQTPINNCDEIEEPFLFFDAGASRFDVWHWFDERCPNGLAVDLMGETTKSI